MNIKSERTGVIYQFEDSFEGYSKPVVVDISYSGNVDVDGNDVLEFEWANITEEANPDLTPDQIEEFNDALECGREEEYVQLLVGLYKDTAIRFDVGEYKYNPLSTLYNVNAK